MGSVVDLRIKLGKLLPLVLLVVVRKIKSKQNGQVYSVDIRTLLKEIMLPPWDRTHELTKICAWQLGYKWIKRNLFVPIKLVIGFFALNVLNSVLVLVRMILLFSPKRISKNSKTF